MVSENPMAFLDQHIILGGAVVAIKDEGDGSVLEVMEWQLNRWGEPTYLDDNGRRFLVKSSKALDPAIYEPGTLVTLAGVVLGQETHLLEEHDYSYPVLDLTEIHLWEIPFRFGLFRNIDPAYPHYVDPGDDPDRHPYDPGYSTYPYTPYWYREAYQ
jgi:outer membrane lipoprotein